MTKRLPASGVLLPGEASTVISVVAVLVGLSGAQALVRLGFLLFGLIAGIIPTSEMTVVPIVLLVLLALLAVLQCTAAIWLYQARRRGGWLAMGVLTLSLLGQLVDSPRASTLGIVLTVAALIGVALAWPQLSPDGHELEDDVRVTRRLPERNATS